MHDLRKYSFAVRVVNIWNSLPDSVISRLQITLIHLKTDYR